MKRLVERYYKELGGDGKDTVSRENRIPQKLLLLAEQVGREDIGTSIQTGRKPVHFLLDISLANWTSGLLHEPRVDAFRHKAMEAR